MKDDGPFKSNWRERKWFRSRIVFYGYVTDRKPVDPAPVSGFVLSEHVLGSERSRNNLREWLPRVITEKEIPGVRMTCLTVEERESKRRVGAATLMCADTAGIWYDNLPMAQGECRLVGLYVDPEFRGFGLGSWLQHARFRMAVLDPRCGLVSAVVESHRLPSIRAQRSRFKTETRNILIKICGRNVLSVVKNGPHKGVWYVGPFRERKWVRMD